MISARARGQEFCKIFVEKTIGFFFIKVFMLKCLQTHCVWYDFDMDARVMTLWYFLQGIIEICCLEIKKCARMVLFDRDEGGDRYRDLLAWYEFI